MIALTIYILSTALGWLHIHIAYSKGGIGEGHGIQPERVVIMFIPVLNTVLATIFWIYEWPVKKAPNDAYNKFFRIKK